MSVETYLNDIWEQSIWMIASITHKSSFSLEENKRTEHTLFSRALLFFSPAISCSTPLQEDGRQQKQYGEHQ